MREVEQSPEGGVMLEVTDLVKSYASEQGKGIRVRGADGVSFSVEQGEMFTLLGPSGCGKTTALRSIAGLERPDSGRIVVGGRTLFSSLERINVPAEKRGLGMVFQSYAIWPHMSVFQNVAFPLVSRPRRDRPSRHETAERVQRALAMVELEELESRPATNLSGGQQQRLALARALVMDSPLLLLDEPLSNLDAKLRETMRFELRRLQRRHGITAIYVTHDQTEALGMSSRIAVMNEGRVVQVGTPKEVYHAPADEFVADFIGTSNFVEGTVVDRVADGGYNVDIGPAVICAQSNEALSPGARIALSIRPERLKLEALRRDDPRPSSVGTAKGTVMTQQFLGEVVDYVLRIGDLELRARTNPAIDFPRGTEVAVEFDPEQARIVGTRS